MMYNNKFVTAIKVNGKILREFKDTVYVKFGSEYSILLKNLNSVKALVNVYIDGENVTPSSLVIMPNQEVDLERSLANGNLSQGNKFKFIERSGSVEQNRGIKLEDGLVKVEFKFEKPLYSNFYTKNSWNSQNTFLNNETHCGSLNNVSISYCSTTSSTIRSSVEPQNLKSVTDFNETGITVPGSVSDQQFHTVSSFTTEAETHVMVFKILGETENKPVETVTVKSKPKCVTCGRLNKSSDKFCTNCGTSLQIV